MENSEKWREQYTEKQLVRLQQLEFKELKVVKSICEQLNIKFFLYGGTLLGAYKYHGFIPWDDDVDIAMERESYEKFIAEAPKLLSKDYVLQNLLLEPKSPYSYTKLRLKGTRCIEEYNHELDIEQGIYMDIYPVDTIPDDDKEYQMQFDKIQTILANIYYRQNPKRNKSYGIKYWLYGCLLRLLPANWWMHKLNAEMTKYNGCPYQRKTCWYYPNIKNYYKQLQPLISVQFEGEEFWAPNDTESHLNRRYGDISVLPPIEKRIGHYIHVLDFGKFINNDPE